MVGVSRKKSHGSCMLIGASLQPYTQSVELRFRGNIIQERNAPTTNQFTLRYDNKLTCDMMAILE